MRASSSDQRAISGASKRTIELLMSDSNTRAEIVEVSDGYFIDVAYANDSKVRLITARGEVRVFKKIDSAMAFLKSIGCSQCRVTTLIHQIDVCAS